MLRGITRSGKAEYAPQLHPLKGPVIEPLDPKGPRGGPYKFSNSEGLIILTDGRGPSKKTSKIGAGVAEAT